MNSKTAMILVMIGMLITLGGVGGVEASLSDSHLIASVLISTVGLVIMYCGTLALNVSDYYDQH